MVDGKKLPIPDLTIKNYVPLLDDKLQFTLSKGEKSPRHRIVNNLPGTINFCPLVRKTKKIEEYASQDFASLNEYYLKGIRKSILQRAAAFLLLKDSIENILLAENFRIISKGQVCYF